MRRFILLVTDVTLMVLAALAALVLLCNFEVSESRLWKFFPYAVATAAASAAVFIAADLSRAIWRFSALTGYLRVTGAVAAAVCVAAAMGYAYNRLDGVPGSLPILQLLAGQALLTGARACHRLDRTAREHRKALAALLEPAGGLAALTVLVVGISRLTEAYLQAAAELAPGRIRVAGLAGHADRYAGRLVANYPVLGVPEDIERILSALEARGIHTDRIVIAAPFESLSPEAREALLRVQHTRKIPLHFLAQNFGFEAQRRIAASGGKPPFPDGSSFEFSPAELASLAARPFGRLKRVPGTIAAFALLVASAPFLLLTAVCVIASMGFPAIVWQQRLGPGGRLFRLYRFRTMRASHSPDGRRLADWERITLTGNLLRRLRLDGLPQLFNILRGDMPFIVPGMLLALGQRNTRRPRFPVRIGLKAGPQPLEAGISASKMRPRAAFDTSATQTWP